MILPSFQWMAGYWWLCFVCSKGGGGSNVLVSVPVDLLVMSPNQHGAHGVPPPRQQQQPPPLFVTHTHPALQPCAERSVDASWRLPFSFVDQPTVLSFFEAHITVLPDLQGLFGFSRLHCDPMSQNEILGVYQHRPLRFEEPLVYANPGLAELFRDVGAAATTKIQQQMQVPPAPPVSNECLVQRTLLFGPYPPPGGYF